MALMTLLALPRGGRTHGLREGVKHLIALQRRDESTLHGVLSCVGVERPANRVVEDGTAGGAAQCSLNCAEAGGGLQHDGQEVAAGRRERGAEKRVAALGRSQGRDGGRAERALLDLHGAGLVAGAAAVLWMSAEAYGRGGRR